MDNSCFDFGKAPVFTNDQINEMVEYIELREKFARQFVLCNYKDWINKLNPIQFQLLCQYEEMRIEKMVEQNKPLSYNDFIHKILNKNKNKNENGHDLGLGFNIVSSEN